MKKAFLFMFLLLSITVMSQTNFKIEKNDSVAKTKSQIYSDTKMFIAENWKSAQSVIQNDDKEAGMILIKGTIKQSVNMGMGAINEFWYSYNVKFLMKEGKFKIVVENVLFDRGPNAMWSSKDLKPQDTFPGIMKVGFSEKKWILLMTSLKSDMQSIVDRYDQYIKKKSAFDDF